MSTAKLSVISAVLCLACLVAVAQETNVAKESQGFSGYPGAPAFSVVPRKDELEFYPCTQCHEFMEPDATARELMAPHEINLEHGAGRFWCLSCHQLENRDTLKSAMGQAVDFDDAHLVCGGCHGNRHKDWHFGAHGKRQENWEGQRVIYSCTHCHNPHSPAIAPRKPMPPPKQRAGLETPEREHHETPRIWERRGTGNQTETSHEK